jgi:hypothetical protein
VHPGTEAQILPQYRSAARRIERQHRRSDPTARLTCVLEQGRIVAVTLKGGTERIYYSLETMEPDSPTEPLAEPANMRPRDLAARLRLLQPTSPHDLVEVVEIAEALDQLDDILDNTAEVLEFIARLDEIFEHADEVLEVVGQFDAIFDNDDVLNFFAAVEGWTRGWRLEIQALRSAIDKALHGPSSAPTPTSP